MKKVLQQPSPSIERLLQHQRYLDYLSKRLLTYLPAEFLKKISVLGITSSTANKRANKQILIVSVTSAAWASKLRFYLPTLKRSLCAEAQFSHIQSIRIKVISATEKTPPKKNKHLVYSNYSAKIVASSAQHISDDSLRTSLLRLSQHISENS